MIRFRLSIKLRLITHASSRKAATLHAVLRRRPILARAGAREGLNCFISRRGGEGDFAAGRCCSLMVIRAIISNIWLGRLSRDTIIIFSCFSLSLRWRIMMILLVSAI